MDYLFLSEDDEVVLEDLYVFSKVCGEWIGVIFVCCFGVDIYVLCIGNVIELLEYVSFFFSFVG